MSRTFHMTLGLAACALAFAVAAHAAPAPAPKTVNGNVGPGFTISLTSVARRSAP